MIREKKWHVKMKPKPTEILILATDEHGETRINTEEFNKLTIIQKNKYSSVKIRDNPCKSVAKKSKLELRLKLPWG